MDAQNDGLEKVDSFVAIFGMLDFCGVHPVCFFGIEGKIGIGGPSWACHLLLGSATCGHFLQELLSKCCIL